jgi:hypothetical protein
MPWCQSDSVRSKIKIKINHKNINLIKINVLSDSLKSVNLKNKKNITLTSKLTLKSKINK